MKLHRIAYNYEVGQMIPKISEYVKKAYNIQLCDDALVMFINGLLHIIKYSDIIGYNETINYVQLRTNAKTYTLYCQDV